MLVILPMTQLLFSFDLNLEEALTQLEECSELVIAWLQNNYMKLNIDKCHLLMAGHKFEHNWVRVGPYKKLGSSFRKTSWSLNRQRSEV